MRCTATEKLKIIRLVDGSETGLNRTLKELGIHKSTFYNWYGTHQQRGPEGLLKQERANQQVWNKLPLTNGRR